MLVHCRRAKPRYAEVLRESDRPGLTPGAMPQVVQRTGLPVLGATPTRRPKKRTGLIAAILSLIGLPILVGGVSGGGCIIQATSRPRLRQRPAVRMRQARRRAGTEAARRGRITRARDNRGESSSTLLEAQEANLQVQAARSS